MNPLPGVKAGLIITAVFIFVCALMAYPDSIILWIIAITVVGGYIAGIILGIKEIKSRKK